MKNTLPKLAAIGLLFTTFFAFSNQQSQSQMNWTIGPGGNYGYTLQPITNTRTKTEITTYYYEVVVHFNSSTASFPSGGWCDHTF